MTQNNHYNEDEEQYSQELEEYKRCEPITEASYVYCEICDKVHAGKCDFQQ